MMECQVCRQPQGSFTPMKRLEGQPSAFICLECDKLGRLWAAKNAFLLKMSENLNAAASGSPSGQHGDKPEGSSPAPGPG